MSGILTVVAPRADCSFDYFAQKVVLGARGVFRREFDVVAIADGALDAGDGSLHDFFARHFQFELSMDRAGCEKHVNASVLAELQRLPGTIDVGVVTARQAANRRAAKVGRDFSHCFKVTGRSNRETAFDHVDAQIDECLGNLQLFVQIHTRAGRLFAVAEGRVKDLDDSWFGHCLVALWLLDQVVKIRECAAPLNAGSWPAPAITTAPSTVKNVSSNT